MPEQVRAVRTRAETPEEADNYKWFEEQARDPFKPIEEAARQIIQLVTVLYTVVFGILAFASDPVPAYLARASVRGIGLATVICYLVALLAALTIVVPRGYQYAKASQTQRKQVYDSLLRRKSFALTAAVWAFGVASFAFALLFVVVLLGL